MSSLKKLIYYILRFILKQYIPLTSSYFLRATSSFPKTSADRTKAHQIPKSRKEKDNKWQKKGKGRAFAYPIQWQAVAKRNKTKKGAAVSVDGKQIIIKLATMAALLLSHLSLLPSSPFPPSPSSSPSILISTAAAPLCKFPYNLHELGFLELLTAGVFRFAIFLMRF